jgi:hypothetical protein
LAGSGAAGSVWEGEAEASGVAGSGGADWSRTSCVDTAGAPAGAVLSARSLFEWATPSAPLAGVCLLAGIPCARLPLP